MINDLTQEIASANAINSELIVSLLLSIRKCGAKTPTKLTTLLKNALALDRFAKKAGYNGMLEAYFS